MNIMIIAAHRHCDVVERSHDLKPEVWTQVQNLCLQPVGSLLSCRNSLNPQFLKRKMGMIIPTPSTGKSPYMLVNRTGCRVPS